MSALEGLFASYFVCLCASALPVNINKSSELYRKYRVEKPEPVAVADGAPAGTVFVEELFGIPKRLWPLFDNEDDAAATGVEVTDRMNRREARDAFLRRVKRMDALKDGQLTMDEALAKTLLKSGAVVVEGRLPMNDALVLWFEQLDKFHRVGVVGGKSLERKACTDDFVAVLCVLIVLDSAMVRARLSASKSRKNGAAAAKW